MSYQFNIRLFRDEDIQWITRGGKHIPIKGGKVGFPEYIKRPNVKIISMDGLVPTGYPKDIPIGLTEYIGKIKRGEKIEPIVVRGRVIIDGSHRYWAAKKLGYTHLAAIVQKKSL